MEKIKTSRHGDDDLNLDVTQDEGHAGGTQNSTCKLRVTVQDFEAGLALPRYGGDQPNTDYYASNLIVNNMTFVNWQMVSVLYITMMRGWLARMEIV